MKSLLGWLFFLAVSNTGVASDPLDVWHFRNPLPTGNPRSSVEFLNGRFISPGSNGEVLVSTDGINWSRRLIPGGANLSGVAFGNDLYAVIGSDPTGPKIYISPDLEHWTAQTVPNTNFLNAITFGNGVFVAVGNGGLILSSANGTDWTIGSSLTSEPLASVAFGGGTFVATSRTFVGGYLASVSSDGVSWSRVHLGVRFHTGVNYLNGQFHVGGYDLDRFPPPLPRLSTSSDGTNWSVRATSTVIWDMTFANGNYLAMTGFVVQNGDLHGSSDGTNFFLVTNIAAKAAITHGNGLFVAVGSLIQTSGNGTNWATVISGPTSTLTDIAFGNSSYAAVGGGYALPSGGISGTADPTAIATAGSELAFAARPAPVDKSLSRVQFADGLFHVAGFNGTLLRSTNGQHWVRRNSGVPTHLRSLTYADGLWVAVGDNWRGYNFSRWSSMDAAILRHDLPAQRYYMQRQRFCGSGFIWDDSYV